MSLSNPYAQYRQNAVETASPTRLVVMLYDGAIRFLNQALPAMQAKDYYNQSQYIGRAQEIILHLQGTLDFEAGGEVAKSLDAMYWRLYNALSEANINDKPEKVQDALTALRELREAWIEVDRQCQTQKSQPRPAASPYASSRPLAEEMPALRAAA